MRSIPEVAEDIKSILNNIERTEECTGETLVDINELVDEILTISAAERNTKHVLMRKCRVGLSGRCSGCTVEGCIARKKDSVTI